MSRMMMLAQVSVIVEDDGLFLDVMMTRNPDFKAGQAQSEAGQEECRFVGPLHDSRNLSSATAGGNLAAAPNSQHHRRPSSTTVHLAENIAVYRSASSIRQ